MKHLALAFLILALAGCNRPEPATTGTDSTDGTLPPESTAPGSETASAPSNDAAFAATASMANLYEIMAGELALQKATGAACKEFAQTMVTQHKEIGESYKPIAEKQGLPMPTALDGEFKTLYDALVAAQGGAAFEALYRQQMIDTHAEALPLFRSEAASGQDPELKAFAARWVDTVAHHLEMANALPPAQG
jgi:putative membrane protein